MKPYPLSYEARLSAERAIFGNQIAIHDLPPIHHYWANRHLRLKLEALGFSSPDDLFFQTLQRCSSKKSGSSMFLSVGAGNGDTELEIAARLRESGVSNFAIVCLDLNEAMLARGRENADRRGLGAHLEFQSADFNSWEPVAQFDAVIVNQSLHHVVNLEHLFESIRQALLPGAPFVISDMIGRNGHQRWPEARAIVDEYWRKLPPSCRFNHVLNRFEECFQDFDCSGEGFEGIRSQDILPLLTRSFHFEFFFGFANIIDPFIDRQFGPNLDPSVLWVRRFIDAVHHRDEAEQLAGNIKPTHLLAVVTATGPAGTTFSYPTTPLEAVRDPDRVHLESNARPDCGYDYSGWSYTVLEELTELTHSLVAAQHKATELARWGQNLDRDVAERTAWALKLDQQLAQSQQLCRHLAEQISLLEQQMAERTAWALQLDRQVRTLEGGVATEHQHTAELEKELVVRTEWARSLESQFDERTKWALRLQNQLESERQASQQKVYLSPRQRRIYHALKSIALRLSRRK